MSEEKQEPLTVQDFKSFKICQYNLGHSSIPNLGHLRGEQEQIHSHVGATN